jgi:hypothetical protein
VRADALNRCRRQQFGLHAAAPLPARRLATAS